MISYTKPEIRISHFDSHITANDATVSAVEQDKVYAAEVINDKLLNGYGSNRATTMKINNILSFQ